MTVLYLSADLYDDGIVATLCVSRSRSHVPMDIFLSAGRPASSESGP